MESSPNSKAAAHGSEHVQSLASHSVTPSHTMTKLKHSSLWITDTSGNVNQYLAYTSTRLSAPDDVRSRYRENPLSWYI